jgi:hypothetical protein
MSAVLVDTGPIVALLDRSDDAHERCKRALSSLSGPLLTVWPVLTEAMYLLAFSWTAQAALWEWVEGETLKLLPLDQGDLPRMRELMHKYRDLPMDLADAALVRVAEREKVRRVFTIDRRDFALYRPAGLGRFTILPR